METCEADLFELLVENFADRIGQLDLPGENRRQHVSQRHHSQDHPTETDVVMKTQHVFFGGVFISCNVRRATHPASSTTGAWSKPFSFRILMVCWQLTVGRTVSGADRFRLCTFRFHHLAEQILAPDVEATA